jgi:choline dehydrogenase-like flavoprotein
MSGQFDAIVIGSGISGGWAAKELCEKGLRTLVLERGRDVRHAEDYMDHLAPWELPNRDLAPQKYHETGDYEMARRKGWVFKSSMLPFLVNDKDYPFSYPEDRFFMWTRGYQTGGRSLTWGRQSYRWGPKDFEANKRDGHGVDWPIRYSDLEKYYAYVERFAGISGNRDGLADLPDGEFQPPFEMSAIELAVRERLTKRFPDRRLIMGRAAHLTEPTAEQQALGRGQCQSRDICHSGCSYGAYFSSQSATLPAARATGRLTLVNDAIVHSLEQDARSGRISGVRVIDRSTRATRTYSAPLVFVCASTIGSIQILLNSRTAAMPNGVGNHGGLLGAYITDHIGAISGNGSMPELADRYPFGRRPSCVYIPNYRHEKTQDVDFVRGYGFDCYGQNRGYLAPEAAAGLGTEAKAKIYRHGDWTFHMNLAGEMLPYADNRASLHPSKVDRFGIPLIHLDCSHRANEERMSAQAEKDIVEMLTAVGCSNVTLTSNRRDKGIVGYRTHEMGGACMGRDPRTSVTDAWGQVHHVPNLFVGGGPVMSSCATQNPSLTYMAMTVRSVEHAVKRMKQGEFA